jgi:hypothetical protein
LVTAAKQCPPFPKTNFGQINSRTIVAGVEPQCLGRGQCALKCNITNGKKNEDLQGMIRSTHCVYARQLKMTWDVKNWDQKSSKTS